MCEYAEARASLLNSIRNLQDSLTELERLHSSCSECANKSKEVKEVDLGHIPHTVSLELKQQLEVKIAPEIAFWANEITHVAKTGDNICCDIVEADKIPKKLWNNWRLHMFAAWSYYSYNSQLMWDNVDRIKDVGADLRYAFQRVLGFNKHQDVSDCFLKCHTFFGPQKATNWQIAASAEGEWHKVKVKMLASGVICEARCALSVSRLNDKTGLPAATFIFHAPRSDLSSFRNHSTQPYISADGITLQKEEHSLEE